MIQYRLSLITVSAYSTKSLEIRNYDYRYYMLLVVCQLYIETM
jgi:hypothetical protein